VLLRTHGQGERHNELVRKAAPVLSKLVLPTSNEEQSNLRLKLANAGFRPAAGADDGLASKTVCAVVGLALALAAGFTMHAKWTTLLGAAAGAAGLGMMLPELWLSGAAAAASRRFRHGCPIRSTAGGFRRGRTGARRGVQRVGEEMATVHPIYRKSCGWPR